MKTEAQLLLNCPKCNSGKLMFVRPAKNAVFIECLECKYPQPGFYTDSLAAAKYWNELSYQDKNGENSGN